MNKSKRKTEPYIFFIESFKPSEKEREGEVIHRVLRDFKEKKCCYRFVNNTQDFQKALNEFNRTGYRYLHISCHGSRRGITVGEERIRLETLSKLLQGVMTNKRLFLSSCLTTNEEFRDKYFIETAARSVLGFYDKVYFDDAVVFWVTFYHLVFNEDFINIANENLEKISRKIATMLRLKMRLIIRDKTQKKGFRSINLRHKKT